MPNKSSISVIQQQSQLLFKWFAGILLFSLLMGIAFEAYFLFALPAFMLLTFVTLVDFRKIFYLLLICLPISTEFYFPNGLATDLPTEPLMVGLMGVYFLYVLRHGREMSSRFIRHPLTLLLILHLFWILATTITSSLYLVSIKYTLAKVWYITVFFFMVGSMIKNEKEFKTAFWCIAIPLVCTVGIILLRHASYGFTFGTVEKTLKPFFRNHVNYAALLSLFLPFIWFARQWFPKHSTKRWLVNGSVLLLLMGIQFAYTRTAYVTLIMAAGAFFVVHFRLIKIALAGALVVTLLGFAYLINNNKYMEYAPNFERTVVHRNFDNLVQATAAGEDISTMERFYRWIAGIRMAAEKPIVGYGPGNFYFFYKAYTVNRFRTYVSGNPEQSTIHNYFLLMMVEQGFPGMIIFIVLSFYALIKGEQIYHQSPNQIRKGIVMGAILSLVVINAFLLINDMIETDKMGTFFFMNIAVIVNMDLLNKKEARNKSEVSKKTD